MNSADLPDCASAPAPETGDPESVRSAVRQKYGEAARRAAAGALSSCCGSAPETGCADPITSKLYPATEVAGLPRAAVLASLGCGNPTALAELHPGEIVLDLGSGGGIDVLLSARRVGPTGKAYGLDSTAAMLSLARDNARKAGASNVEFLEGEIEVIPLPDQSVDVIISNCVINLSTDKPRALREAFRVLRPGGRFAVSDIVIRGDLPAAVRKSMDLWVGCIAGALPEEELVSLLAAVGFVETSVEPTRIYQFDGDAQNLDGRVMGAFIRTRKPERT